MLLGGAAGAGLWAERMDDFQDTACDGRCKEPWHCPPPAATTGDVLGGGGSGSLVLKWGWRGMSLMCWARRLSSHRMVLRCWKFTAVCCCRISRSILSEHPLFSARGQEASLLPILSCLQR